MDDFLGIVFVLLLGAMCWMVLVAAGVIVLAAVTAFWIVLGVAIGISRLHQAWTKR